MKRQNICLREQQAPEHCWAVDHIFSSDELWEQTMASFRDLPEKIAAYKGKLGEDPAVLLAYLQLMEKTNLQTEKLYVYAMLRSDEDTANPKYQAMKGRCFSFLVELNSAGAFEGPELVAIPDDTMDRFYEQQPELEYFRRYLTKARLNRKHILTPAEEILLAGAGEIGSAPGTIFNTLLDADMTFPDCTDSSGQSHPLTGGTYISIMESSDRALRQDAFQKLYGVYGGLENTLAAAYNGEVRKNLFFACARKYDSALESALAPNEVPIQVYQNLIRAVRDSLPAMHRYMRLRKKCMGLDELHMYDVYAPMVPDSDRKISFEEAKQDVLDSAAVLGDAYVQVLQKAFSTGWLDVYENKGKRSGAYSCRCASVHPFVLLNHTDDLNSAFTLAHEMGHAMHSYLSEKKQPHIYADYVLFVAEVASTCNEALLMQHLLEKTQDKKTRAVLINYFLEQFRTTLYRQTMFAEFEWKAHEMAQNGETLTAQMLKEMYLRLNQDYYGEDVVIDPEIAIEWARIPHFYRHFYVYQYATGFSAAMALSRRILSQGETAVEDYLKFLSGGSSADPISLLKAAGVDMSTAEPVQDALALFEELIDQMEALYGAAVC